MGGTAFYLAAHDNSDTVELSSLWHPRPLWKYLGTSILLGLAVGVGFLLLIVPGIIFALMFIFSTFLVIDREIDPIEAMKESYRMTRGHKWNLLGLLLMLILVNLLGVLALIVGLLVSVPVTALALTHAYRVLGGTAGMRPVDAVLAPSRSSSSATASSQKSCKGRGARYSAGTSGCSAFAASAALRGLR